VPPAEPFDDAKPKPAVRVLYPDSWEIWSTGAGDKLELVDSGEHPFGEVPLVPFYCRENWPAAVADRPSPGSST
jgi:hypothetical protein